MSARPVTVEYKGISQINDIQLLIHNTLPPPENLSEGAYPWPVEDNSLTSDIISGTSEWISRNDANRFLGVAVIRGGPTVFCQGEKLELETNGVSSVMIEYYKRVYNLIHKLSSVSTPLLTLMQGRTSFSGLGFGCAAQHSVTTDETVVSMPSVAFGLVPSGGSTYHLSRLRGSLGLFVALGAGEIVGPHCYMAGVSKRYCSWDRLDDLAILAQSVTHNPTLDDMNFSALCESPKDSASFWEFKKAIDEVFVSDSVDEILDKLAKSERTETLAKLQNSPRLALKLTFEMMARAHELSLIECMEMEFGVLTELLTNYQAERGSSDALVQKIMEDSKQHSFRK